LGVKPVNFCPTNFGATDMANSQLKLQYHNWKLKRAEDFSIDGKDGEFKVLKSYPCKVKWDVPLS
jgi:hypothetical protein